MTQMNIALCTDDNYAGHCAVCVTSILENNKEEAVRIYILTEGLKEENRRKFTYLSEYYKQEINIKVLDNRTFEHLQVSSRLPRSIYFRYLLPNIVQDERVLYLDSDIIVRGSLKELFRMDLTQISCGVVLDQCCDDVRIHNRINMFSDYFNSGVLLINNSYWRENNILEKLIKYIKEHDGKLFYPDQDALNVVLEHTLLFLDYKYNFQQGFYNTLVWIRKDRWEKIEKDKQTPIILHYTGNEKPWHKDCVHPLVSEYDRYMYMHRILWEKKRNCHPWQYYMIENTASFFKKRYHGFRRRNSMIVNEV